MFLSAYNKKAITWMENSYTYLDLLGKVDHYASLYKSTGKVLIFAENRPEWIFALYSAWRKGLPAVPVDFMSTPREVAYILEDCHPETAFCSRKTEPIFREAMTLAGFSLDLLVFEEIPPGTEGEGAPLVPRDMEETALIIYTSGTTGSPKGVMLTYDNLLANIQAVSREEVLFTDRDRVLLFLPLHHALPLLGTVICPLMVGASLSLAPSMDSREVLKTIKENRVTIIVGVPRFFVLIRNSIMEKIKKKALTRFFFSLARKAGSPLLSRLIFRSLHQLFGGALHFMACGGAAVDPEVERDLRTLGFTFLAGFGMTEAAPMISFTRPGKEQVGSSGHPLSCNEVRVHEGEILTRGRNVMKGYYNRPEETSAVIKDGWLYTGDLGYLDEEGRLFITGRKKEIIVLPSGKNVNPQEVEFKLETFPLVREAGVFLRQNVLVGVIVPQVDEKAGEKEFDKIWEEVILPYNESVSPYKRIGKLVLSFTPLPRTRLEKLKRHELEQLDTRETASLAETEPTYREYAAVRDFLKERCGAEVFPNSHILRDLGLDSLDRVGLIFFIKDSFGVELNEDLLALHATAEKLGEYLRAHSVQNNITRTSWGAILKEKVHIKLPRSLFTQNLFRNLSKVFFKFFFRLKIHGREKLPGRPCILAPNHQSFMDGMLVAAGLNKKQLKRTYFYAKAKHVRRGIAQFLAERNNVIVVDIRKELTLSIQKLAAALKQGGNVMIFPEGTRSADGSLGTFKKTFAILSHELKVPVVPVVIQGAFDALPRGSFFPRLGRRIQVSFLDAVEVKDSSPDSICTKVMDSINKVLRGDKKSNYSV